MISTEGGIDPDFWHVLRARIEAEVEERAHNIASGKCKSMESYADHVGFVRGLRWVLNSAHDIMNPSPIDTNEEGD